MRQSVGADLLKISVVPFDPCPTDVKLGIQRHQLRPQLTVLQLVSASISPALALPVEYEDSHSVDQVLRVRMQFDARPVWKWPKRLYSCDQLHFRDGRLRKGTGHFPTSFPLHHNRAPATGARVSDRGAVRENAKCLVHREPPARISWGDHRIIGVRLRSSFARADAPQPIDPFWGLSSIHRNDFTERGLLASCRSPQDGIFGTRWWE